MFGFLLWLPSENALQEDDTDAAGRDIMVNRCKEMAVDRQCATFPGSRDCRATQGFCPSRSQHGGSTSDMTVQTEFEEMKMATGNVKWFNPAKGFGFIAPEDTGKDVFIHISALERAGISGLAEGQRIEYEVAAGRDGRTSAENVRLVD